MNGLNADGSFRMPGPWEGVGYKPDLDLDTYLRVRQAVWDSLTHSQRMTLELAGVCRIAENVTRSLGTVT